MKIKPTVVRQGDGNGGGDNGTRNPPPKLSSEVQVGLTQDCVHQMCTTTIDEGYLRSKLQEFSEELDVPIQELDTKFEELRARMDTWEPQTENRIQQATSEAQGTIAPI